MKKFLLLLGILLLTACSSQSLPPVNYVISVTGTPGSGYTASYQINSGTEVAIPASLPQTINLAAQPAVTAVSARVTLTRQGNVVLTITANGEVCESGNAVNTLGAGQTAQTSISCTR